MLMVMDPRTEADELLLDAADLEECPALRALRPQQQAFVLGYCEHFNAMRAYIDAGYQAKHARSCASHALAKPAVRRAVSQVLRSVGITPERIRSSHAEIAFADIADLEGVLEGDKLETARKAGAPTHLIRKIKRERRITKIGDGEEVVTERTEIELYDRQRSLGELADLEGMKTQKVQHSGEIRGPGLIVNLPGASPCKEVLPAEDEPEDAEESP